MNRRRNRFDKAMDHMEIPAKVICWCLLCLFVLGCVRTIAYAHGAELIHHWYDAPFRWVGQMILG